MLIPSTDRHHTGAVSTLIRSSEAAAILDVTKATLYAYVSRGRLARTTAPDGRTSLFARDEVEQLAERSRRAPSGPRATIDVQISSGDHRDRRHLAELSGPRCGPTGSRPPVRGRGRVACGREPPSNRATTWPALDCGRAERPVTDRRHCRSRPSDASPRQRQVLAELHSDSSPDDAARRPPHRHSGRAGLGSAHRPVRRAARHRVEAPAVTDTRRRNRHGTGPARRPRAGHEHVRRTDRRIGPHLAVRRHSPPGSPRIEGRCTAAHAAEANRFLDECAETEPSLVLARYRTERRPVPGFGHKVYRGVDPAIPAGHSTRCDRLDPAEAELLDAVVAEAGRVMAAPTQRRPRARCPDARRRTRARHADLRRRPASPGGLPTSPRSSDERPRPLPGRRNAAIADQRHHDRVTR